MLSCDGVTKAVPIPSLSPLLSQPPVLRNLTVAGTRAGVASVLMEQHRAELQLRNRKSSAGFELNVLPSRCSPAQL